MRGTNTDIIDFDSTDNTKTEEAEGIVIRAGRGLYAIQTTTGRIVPCRLRGNLKKSFTYTESNNRARRVERTKKLRETDPIAVGDRVQIAILHSGRDGVIEKVEPRRSALSRKSGNERERQTLVANLELAVVTFSASEPRPDLWRLDRFLVLAEDAELDIVIVLNKADLVEGTDLAAIADSYRAIGYNVLLTSAHTGQNVDVLRDCLRNRISAFCGPSGVGKSSLVNALQPGLRLKTAVVSVTTFKGRHTTVAAELMPLSFGGWVADTPGLRQVEFWDLDAEDVAFCFPEMAALMGHCKFANCQHRTEPGCAVRAAVAAGKIQPRRYESYLEITKEPSR